MESNCLPVDILYIIAKYLPIEQRIKILKTFTFDMYKYYLNYPSFYSMELLRKSCIFISSPSIYSEILFEYHTKALHKCDHKSECVEICVYPFISNPYSLKKSEITEIIIRTYAYSMNKVKYVPENLECLKILISPEKEPFKGHFINYANIADRDAVDMSNLPDNLKKIIIKDLDNISFNKLPEKLQVLCLKNNFNSHLDDLLDTKHLTTLILGNEFNQPISYYPETLQILHFGNNFNQQLENLPYALQEIKVGLNYKQSLDALPLNLKRIYINSENFNDDFDFSKYTKLTKLAFGKYCPHNQKLNLLNLPANIEYIKFGWNFNQEINNLPDSVEQIVFSNYCRFNKKITRLPKSINIYVDKICEN